MVIIHFFYDGVVTEKLCDLASCVSAEVDPGVFPYLLNDEITARLDYPQKIPIQGRLVYLRKEPIPTTYKQISAIELADDSIVPVALLLLTMQDALLGKVTPELRQVNIGADKETKQLDFYFFYDGEISKENRDLAESAIQEASIWFPEHKMHKDIRRVDFPQKAPELGTRCAYCRYESAVEKSLNSSYCKRSPQ